eukprot:COSAG06_NODE_85_length_25072_cov_62.049453_7_plen_143_part_00
MHTHVDRSHVPIRGPHTLAVTSAGAPGRQVHVRRLRVVVAFHLSIARVIVEGVVQVVGLGHLQAKVRESIFVRTRRPLDSITSRIAPTATASFFECFPYACPEPVLVVKSSFLSKNGFKKGMQLDKKELTKVFGMAGLGMAP